MWKVPATVSPPSSRISPATAIGATLFRGHGSPHSAKGKVGLSWISKSPAVVVEDHQASVENVPADDAVHRATDHLLQMVERHQGRSDPFEPQLTESQLESADEPAPAHCRLRP